MIPKWLLRGFDVQCALTWLLLRRRSSGRGYRCWVARVQAWAPIWTASQGLPSGGV